MSTKEKTFTLTKDSGVIKDIVIPGQGQKIEAGDILAIEYKASVKGNPTPFAKGDKEQFIVKDGSLIRGWDIAVESMRIGEKSIIQCTAPYAYGTKGVSPVIPPDSDLELEIKVLAWLGNQLRPESLFQKDLDIDPFVASTPEAIQQEYEDMQVHIHGHLIICTHFHDNLIRFIITIYVYIPLFIHRLKRWTNIKVESYKSISIV